jgi:RAD51-like protein 3
VVHNSSGLECREVTFSGDNVYFVSIMRLSLFPFLPQDLVLSLEQIGIRTDSDFLFSSITDILQKLPPGSVTLQDLKIYISEITNKCSALGVRGNILLALEHERQEQELNLGSGVKDLDALLDDFGGSRVFEISGEKASGKTVSSVSTLCGTAFTSNSRMSTSGSRNACRTSAPCQQPTLWSTLDGHNGRFLCRENHSADSVA